MAPETAPPLRTLIVDDEPLARARTRRLLGEIGGATIVGEAGSVEEAARVAAETAPDLVLLDIQMPGEEGFALLPRLAPGTAVVFVTAQVGYIVAISLCDAYLERLGPTPGGTEPPSPTVGTSSPSPTVGPSQQSTPSSSPTPTATSGTSARAGGRLTS